MVISAQRKRERLLEAARGYLMLDMADHALGQLADVQDPERCPYAFHFLRGEALRVKREFKQALKAYSRALVKEPHSISVLMGMAWCYKRTGQLPQAIEATREAYRVQPDEAVVLYNLACYYALAGNKHKSLEWLGRAVRMDGDLRKLIPDESDFDAFRNDPDFQLIAGTREDMLEI